MKTRDDIDPATTYVVSDTHFGHRNIVDFSYRPPDHEQIMLENWAQAVPADATVIHLGDLSFRNNAMFRAVLSKHLTGSRKLLIMGNHDKGRFSFYKRSGFQPVKPFQIGWGDWRVSFCHYPWSDQDDGGPMPEKHLRLHGHIHNSGYSRSAFVPFLKNHVNLSIEQTKYQPVHLGLLLSAVIDGRYPNDAGDSVETLNAEGIQEKSHHV